MFSPFAVLICCLGGLSFIGRRAIEYAAVLDAIDIAKTLLAHKADPDLADGDGRTPLMWAAYHNRFKMSKLLIEVLT